MYVRWKFPTRRLPTSPTRNSQSTARLPSERPSHQDPVRGRGSARSAAVIGPRHTTSSRTEAT